MAVPDHERDDSVAEEVLRTLRRILRRVTEHSKELHQRTGLTLPQILCLKAVATLQEKGMQPTMKNVAIEVDLAPATVSRIVDRMVASGTLDRSPGTEDRRTVLLSLTDKGRTLNADLPVPLQDRFLRRLDALDPKERRALLRALDQVARMMDADDLDAAPILVVDP